MANNCRNTVLAVGTESDITKFLAFVVPDRGGAETEFTQRFETGVLHRGIGVARIEVMSKWTTPLEEFVELTRHFPSLRFAVEWECNGYNQYGCYCLEDGQGEIVDLDAVINPINLAEAVADEPEMDTAMDLKFEIIRETSRLLFGEGWSEGGGPWEEEGGCIRDVARLIASGAIATEKCGVDAYLQHIRQEEERARAVGMLLLASLRCDEKRMGRGRQQSLLSGWRH